MCNKLHFHKLLPCQKAALSAVWCILTSRDEKGPALCAPPNPQLDLGLPENNARAVHPPQPDLVLLFYCSKKRVASPIPAEKVCDAAGSL